LKTLADVAYERVRAMCLGFPAAEEKLSHGAPSFHVRGKMFLMFVDGHHDDTRVAVWCKASPEEQRRLVAEDPARYFVPPYVGVKGWVGVRLDGEDPGWIDLSIVVEEGWRSIAPPRIARGEEVPAPRKKLPPPTRVTTDPALVKALHARFRAICLALPGAEIEEDGWHATFRAKKRPFAYFVDNHHGDGMIGGWVRGDKRANAKLVAAEPERYFIPQYIGARGWVGMRLDLRKVDWTVVSERVAASHALVAPTAGTTRRATSRRKPRRAKR
jgi:hypothetical protein